MKEIWGRRVKGKILFFLCGILESHWCLRKEGELFHNLKHSMSFFIQKKNLFTCTSRSTVIGGKCRISTVGVIGHSGAIKPSSNFLTYVRKLVTREQSRTNKQQTKSTSLINGKCRNDRLANFPTIWPYLENDRIITSFSTRTRNTSLPYFPRTVF